MQLPSFKIAEPPVVRASCLVLALYMVNRAITAIIYPGEASILQAQPQQQASSFYGQLVEFTPSYITNSILFPVLLVVLYRLSGFRLDRPIVGVIGLHFASVVIAIGVLTSSIEPDRTAYEPDYTLYKGSDGNTYTARFSQQGGTQDLPAVSGQHLEVSDITFEDDLTLYYPEDTEKPVALNEIPPTALTPLRARLQAYYEPIMISLFLLMSLVAVRYFYRLDYSGLLPPDQGDDQPSEDSA